MIMNRRDLDAVRDDRDRRGGEKNRLDGESAQQGGCGDRHEYCPQGRRGNDIPGISFSETQFFEIEVEKKHEARKTHAPKESTDEEQACITGEQT